MLKFDRRLILAAAIGASLTLAACNKSGGASASATGDMTLGDPKAPVKMVEYASVTCSHCARFNNEVFPAFKAKYIDTGKVHYTFREFLTPPEAVAAAGFLVARCAGDGKYFTVVDALFRSQEEMYRTGDAKGTLLKVAQSAGMTEAQFSACVQDEKAAQDLNARVEKAMSQDKIAATPTFFINGKKFKEGEVSLEELDAAVAGAGK